MTKLSKCCKAPMEDDCMECMVCSKCKNKCQGHVEDSTPVSCGKECDSGKESITIDSINFPKSEKSYKYPKWKCPECGESFATGTACNVHFESNHRKITKREWKWVGEENNDELDQMRAELHGLHLTKYPKSGLPVPDYWLCAEYTKTKMDLAVRYALNDAIQLISGEMEDSVMDRVIGLSEACDILRKMQNSLFPNKPNHEPK